MVEYRATVSLRMLIPGTRYLARANEEVQREAQRRIRELLIRAGVERSDLVDPEARIPLKVALEESDICAQTMGDPAFSIHEVMYAEPGDAGLYEYLSLSAATLGESIAIAAKYLPLLSDAAEISLVVDTDYAVWRHRLTIDAPGPASAHEFVVSSFILSSRRALGFASPPIEIHFVHEKPTYLAEYEKLFQAPIRFGMQYNQIIMPRVALDLPLVTADPSLHSILTRVADSFMETLALRPAFTQRVKNVIRARIEVGSFELKDIAKKLHMSERTLRRRLQNEGSTYGDLVEEIRKSMSQALLTRTDLAITDIAKKVGFSDPSAFYRCFKQWYGVAPAQYRQASMRNPFFTFVSQERP